MSTLELGFKSCAVNIRQPNIQEIPSPELHIYFGWMKKKFLHNEPKIFDSSYFTIKIILSLHYGSLVQTTKIPSIYFKKV